MAVRPALAAAALLLAAPGCTAGQPGFSVMAVWSDHAVLQSTDDGGPGAIVYGHASSAPN